MRVPAARTARTGDGALSCALSCVRPGGASVMDTCTDTCSPNMAKHSSPVLETRQNPLRHSCCFHRRMRLMFGQSWPGWRLMWNKTVVIMLAYGHDCSRQNMVRRRHLFCCASPPRGGFWPLGAHPLTRSSGRRRHLSCGAQPAPRRSQNAGMAKGGAFPPQPRAGVAQPRPVPRGPASQEDWARRAGAADSLQRGRARNSS